MRNGGIKRTTGRISLGLVAIGLIALITGPATAVVQAPRTLDLTTASSGHTFRIAVGERVQVTLQSNLKWTAPITTAPWVLKERSSTSNGETATGSFVALKSGTAALHSTGAPICKAHAPCPDFVLLWSVTI